MKLLLKFAAACLIIVAYSCSEPSLVGEELLEESIPFNAFVTDTVTVNLKTVPASRLRTNNNNLGIYLLGVVDDSPEFGKTSASIYSQVRLASNNIVLDDGAIYDSLVLRLAYNFHYGDTTSKQTIKVFELSDDLICPSDTCLQNKRFNFLSDPVGELNDYQHQFSEFVTIKRLVFSSDDTTNVEQTETPSHLRIKLNDMLGKRLFDQSGQAAFVDNDAFLDFFKGFHIAIDESTADSSKLMVSYEIQANTFSSLVLYYHTEGQDWIYTDTLQQDSVLVTTYDHQTLGFPINFNANVLNHIINDYNGSDIIDAVNNNLEEDWAYIQAGGGLNIEVEFPYIKNDTFKNVLINRATLTLNQIPANNAIYNPPALINLFDASLYREGAYINGEFEAGSLFNTDSASTRMQYTFNIPALLQDIIEGEHNSTLLLVSAPINIVPVPVKNNFTVDRAILAGNTNDELKAKLELIYTKPE